MLFWVYIFYGLLSSSVGRDLLGMSYMYWIDDLNKLAKDVAAELMKRLIEWEV
jgi:hypothetical protein